MEADGREQGHKNPMKETQTKFMEKPDTEPDRKPDRDQTWSQTCSQTGCCEGFISGRSRKGRKAPCDIAGGEEGGSEPRGSP